MSELQDHGGENLETETPLSEKRKVFLIAGALLILVLIIVNITGGNNTNEQVAKETTTEETSEENKTQISRNNMTLGYGLDEFSDTDQAGRVINYSQGKPTEGEGSEKLVAQVVDGDEENIVYFATEVFDIETKEVLSSIYKYNTVINTWERVYKNVYTEEDTGYAAPFWRVVGKLGNNLVLFQDNKANSPGPCANMLLMSEQEGFELVLLNLEDPYGGFTPISIDEDLKAAAQAEQAACEATFGQ
jgi:hypothetical protein